MWCMSYIGLELSLAHLEAGQRLEARILPRRRLPWSRDMVTGSWLHLIRIKIRLFRLISCEMSLWTVLFLPIKNSLDDLKYESNSRKSDISRTNDDGLTEVIDCRRQQNVLGRTFYGGKEFALGHWRRNFQIFSRQCAATAQSRNHFPPSPTIQPLCLKFWAKIVQQLQDKRINDVLVLVSSIIVRWILTFIFKI